VSTAYQPSTGLLALDAASLAAILDHARGRRIETATRRSLADAGMLVADQLDPPLVPIVAALVAGGPRIRLLSRARGRLTVTDAAFAPVGPDTPAGPAGGESGAGGATVVVRPPDSPVLHLRHARAGAVSRVLAATVGVGPHVLREPPFRTPLDLRDWAVVRSGFDSATPSGWVGRRHRAEFHEMRWAPTPGTRAATALVVAQLDGGLAEIRPRDTGDGVLTVTAADTTSAWRRLCALTTGSLQPGDLGRRPPRRSRDIDRGQRR
jgi:hypothetical protein